MLCERCRLRKDAGIKPLYLCHNEGCERYKNVFNHMSIVSFSMPLRDRWLLQCLDDLIVEEEKSGKKSNRAEYIRKALLEKYGYLRDKYMDGNNYIGPRKIKDGKDRFSTSSLSSLLTVFVPKEEMWVIDAIKKVVLMRQKIGLKASIGSETFRCMRNGLIGMLDDGADFYRDALLKKDKNDTS